MNGLIQRLKNLGYSQSAANHLYATFMSNGNLEVLAAYVRGLEGKK